MLYRLYTVLYDCIACTILPQCGGSSAFVLLLNIFFLLCTTVWESRWSQLPLQTSDLVTVRPWQVKFQVDPLCCVLIKNYGHCVTLLFHIQCYDSFTKYRYCWHLFAAAFIYTCVLSVKPDRWMDGWNILYIIFPCPAGFPLHVCLSFYPSIRLSTLSNSTQHIHTWIFMAKGDQCDTIGQPYYKSVSSSLHFKFQAIWLQHNSSNYTSESHNAAVISDMWNQFAAWNFTHLKAIKWL